MSALSSILAVTSFPTAKVIPSLTKAIQSLLDVARFSLLDTIKLNPKNELTSPEANAFTVLKSLEVTSVVPNKSVICLGPTTMYLGSEGSTSAKSKICFAVLNFAIVKPTVQTDSFGQDNAATPTASVPGKLTYIVGKTPISTGYKPKYDY